MRVKVIADVHGDLDVVQREAASCDVLLVLGDLINVVDYEKASGILAEVYGSDTVRRWASLRADGRVEESRVLFREVSAGREEELRALFSAKIDEAHKAFCSDLPSNVVLTYGNVDVPDLIRRYTPDDVRFVDAGVLEVGEALFGFVGGGLPKVGIPGEVSLPDYAARVEALGPVDVLCAHVPPALDDLTFDVVAGFSEPGSEALLAYIEAHEPDYVYFGHVHQPQEARMRIGSSLAVNVGHHYRVTGRAFDHPPEEGSR